MRSTSGRVYPGRACAIALTFPAGINPAARPTSFVTGFPNGQCSLSLGGRSRSQAAGDAAAPCGRGACRHRDAAGRSDGMDSGADPRCGSAGDLRVPARLRPYRQRGRLAHAGDWQADPRRRVPVRRRSVLLGVGGGLLGEFFLARIVALLPRDLFRQGGPRHGQGAPRDGAGRHPRRHAIEQVVAAADDVVHDPGPPFGQSALPRADDAVLVSGRRGPPLDPCSRWPSRCPRAAGPALRVVHSAAVPRLVEPRRLLRARSFRLDRDRRLSVPRPRRSGGGEAFGARERGLGGGVRAESAPLPELRAARRALLRPPHRRRRAGPGDPASERADDVRPHIVPVDGIPEPAELRLEHRRHGVQSAVPAQLRLLPRRSGDVLALAGIAASSRDRRWPRTACALAVDVHPLLRPGRGADHGPESHGQGSQPRTGVVDADCDADGDLVGCDRKVGGCRSDGCPAPTHLPGLARLAAHGIRRHRHRPGVSGDPARQLGSRA